MIIRCEAARPARLVGITFWIFCGAEPVVALYRYGCLHEHIVERHVCAEHDSVEDIGCRACFELGHECQMVGQLVERIAA